MSSISANDLRIKGVSAIEAELAHQPEAIISVRGKDRFVVMESPVTTICGNANWTPH